MINTRKVSGLAVVVLGLVAGCGGSSPKDSSTGDLYPVPRITGITAAAAFSVGSDGSLRDACGNEFVMRGINHAHTWYTSRTTQAMTDIKATGANTIRVALSSGDRWDINNLQDVTNIVELCRTNELVCVLEVHDTTGFGDDSASVSMPDVVDYWTTLKDAIVGNESFVIINIGNEPHGNNNADNWVTEATQAISALRQEGFSNTLMVDGPNWGQDHQGIMKGAAADIHASDPNVIFSVHMYGSYTSASTIESYMQYYVDNDLPLVVGEFGFQHTENNAVVDVDEGAIMTKASQKDIGYLAWSWSGNGSPVEYLDIAEGSSFDANNLSNWGEDVVADIQATSVAPDPRLFNGECDGDDNGVTTLKLWGTGTVGTRSCTVSRDSQEKVIPCDFAVEIAPGSSTTFAAVAPSDGRYHWEPDWYVTTCSDVAICDPVSVCVGTASCVITAESGYTTAHVVFPDYFRPEAVP